MADTENDKCSSCGMAWKDCHCEFTAEIIEEMTELAFKGHSMGAAIRRARLKKCENSRG